jgi:Kef-type K+ transport system membrane component KefB/Trk K+ transport system NAD-binding subunit
MEQSLKFLPLLLVLLLALLVPLLLSRMRWMPLVVGEIIVGILIGPSAFNLIGRDMTLDFFAEIGLALLMFLSGLEIDFSLLAQDAPKVRRYRPKLIAFVSFSFTLILAGATGLFLVRRGIARDPLIIALILSTTSLGVVVPVLKERGLIPTPFGQAVILSALMADFFTMFLITIYVAVIAHGLSLKILFVGILFVVALLAYRLGAVRLRRLHLEKVLSDLSRTTSQVKIQGAMALMLAFVILAKFLGTEMILGAFLAGVVLSLLDKPADEQTRLRLDAIGFGFFVPLFFITVGIGFDFRALLRDKNTLILAPLLLGAALAIKVLAALIFKVSFSWRQTLAGGFLLSARLSLIIAASGIGASLGIIRESTNAAFILIAALTSTLSPILFHMLIPSRRPGPEKHILILGVNDTALQVARELTLRGAKVCFLAGSELQEQAVKKANFPFSRISEENLDPLQVDLTTVRSFLVLDTSDSRNLRFSQEAVDLKIDHIIVLVNDPVHLPKFRNLNIQTFTPALFQPTLLALMASNPDLFTLLSSTREDQQARLLVLGNSELAGRRLQELRLGADLLVLSIRRGSDRLIPHGKTRLEIGDELTILGSREALQDLARQLEGPEGRDSGALHYRVDH